MWAFLLGPAQASELVVGRHHGTPVAGLVPKERLHRRWKAARSMRSSGIPRDFLASVAILPYLRAEAMAMISVADSRAVPALLEERGFEIPSATRPATGST